MPMLFLLAAALFQSQVLVRDLGDGSFEFTISTTMEQLPVAKERLDTAMKEACGRAGVGEIPRPLIITTGGTPPRFTIIQKVSCKPA